MQTIFEYGAQCAKEYAAGDGLPAATIAEYEGYTSTPNEIEFYKGWESVQPL